MDFIEHYLTQCRLALQQVRLDEIEGLVDELAAVGARGGRLFVVGSGGGAGHASHAVCDFRKLCGLEAYAPYDNVAELTARVNDDGWARTLAEWLRTSRISARDALFVLSVGGGDRERGISENLVLAVDLAKQVGARVLGICGRDGGQAKRAGDAVVVVPEVDPALVTPLTEGLQAVLWHLLVSHPKLQKCPARWESQGPQALAPDEGEGQERVK